MDGDNTQSSVFNLNAFGIAVGFGFALAIAFAYQWLVEALRRKWQQPPLPETATNRTVVLVVLAAGQVFHSIENLAEFFTAVIYKFWLNFLATFWQMKLNPTCSLEVNSSLWFFIIIIFFLLYLNDIILPLECVNLSGRLIINQLHIWLWYHLANWASHRFIK